MLRALAVAGLLFGLGACASAPSDAAVLADAALVIVDAAAPRLDFPAAFGPGSSGSLALGTGWSTPDAAGSDADWRRSAWAAARDVSIYVTLPDSGPLDVFMRVLPFPWTPDAPRQRIAILFNGATLGATTLASGWQDVRVPLPPGLPVNQLVALRLGFAHTRRPVDLGISPDDRQLAAVFSELAIVPRSIVAPREYVRAARYEPERRRVLLPPGSRLRVPLPQDADIVMSVADVAIIDCDRCGMEGSVIEAGERVRPLGGALLSEGAAFTFAAATAPARRSELLLSVSSPPGADGVERGRVSFTLGVRSVTPRGTRRVPSSPPIFIYLVDTLRADALTPYAATTRDSPRMASFARDGVTYLSAHSTSTWTLPAVASLLTGLAPDRHRLLKGEPFTPAIGPMLGTMLAGAGYRSVNITQSFISGPALGFDAGFDATLASDHLNSWNAMTPQTRLLLSRALASAASPPAQPVFAFLHSIDPHAPYHDGAAPAADARAEFWPGNYHAGTADETGARAATLRELYRGGVRAADREFGRFVDFLKWIGVYDESLIVLASDHGEEFLEHGGVEHGRTLYDELTRVPIIVKFPRGRFAGVAVTTPVSIVDVVPTVLAATGLPLPGTPLDGVSLLPGPTLDAAKDRVLGFRTAPNPGPTLQRVDLRGVLVRGLKCIQSATGIDQFGRPMPRLLAFDLNRDPQERAPLPAGGAAAEACQRLLESWAASLSTPRPVAPVSDEIRARLRALGYIR